MPKCAVCVVALEPPVRTPHTVYVKSLYRIAGQDYCRHHIIKAAVAAGVIAEVKAGAGPVAAVAGIESCETSLGPSRRRRSPPTNGAAGSVSDAALRPFAPQKPLGHHRRRFGQSPDIRILTARPRLATMDPSLH